MTTKYKKTALLLGAFTLAVIVIAPSFTFFRGIKDIALSRKETYEVIRIADGLLSDVKDAETAARGFALTGSEAFLDPYLDVRENINDNFDNLRNNTRIEEASVQLDKIAPAIDARLLDIEHLIDLKRGQDMSAVESYVKNGQGKLFIDAIRSEMSRFIIIQEKALSEAEANLSTSMRSMLTVLITTSLFTMICALSFAYLVSREEHHRVRCLVHVETQHLLEIQKSMNQELLKANGALYDSEERLAVTLRSIGDAVIATDAMGLVTLMNPLAEYLTGRTNTSSIGCPVDNIVHIINKETRKPSAFPIEEALEHGTTQNLELPAMMVAFDGTECAIADSCSPIYGYDNQVVGAVMVFRDVTVENAAKQALHDTVVMLQAILNTVVDGIITLNGDGSTIETINQSAERMFGYTSNELLGEDLCTIIPEIEESQRSSFLESCASISSARAKELGCEVMGRRKNGSTIPLEIAVSIMWLNGESHFAGVLRDNTIRKQAEEALVRAAPLQSAIFNSANFSSIATDDKGVIQLFNVGAERMLGYKAMEVVNVITPADISDPVEIIARANALSMEFYTTIKPGFEALIFKASRGIEDIYELTYIRKDGTRFPAVVSVTALRDDSGQIIGYLLIGTEIKAGALQSAIFNSANFSSIATDARGVIQIFNVGAERMLGYTAAEVMNKITPADISDPEEIISRARALSVELETPILPGFEALIFKASRGMEDIYELTYIRKDGSRFPAVVSVTALRDAQEDIIGYLLIGTDNTARKQAEEALLKAGALQSAIFNSENFSSIATDARGVIQIFNVGAERMLGYAASEVVDKITPADISDPVEVISRANELSIELDTVIAPGFEALVFKASRGIEDIYELTYIRKDGSSFPAVVSVTALRDEQSGIIGYLLIGTDNTARKQVEAEQMLLSQRLRDQQFYTRSLFEANIDALMTTDPLGIITDVNKQMEALTGCTRDELIGGPFKNCFTDKERAEMSIRQVLSHKRINNYELTVLARDGKETVVSYNATTFYDRERKLQGMFAAARDVTELKQFEMALRETNIELESAKTIAEKANQAKSEFLSSMSHELRSPLNAILGFAQLMGSESPPPSASQTDSIAQILQAGWHLLKLIDEVLDLAKIESRLVSMSQEAVCLTEVMLECQSMIEAQAQQHKLHVIFPALDQQYYIYADRTRLKQVIVNLVSNAIKYNHENGAVEVFTSVHSPGRIRVSINDTGEGLTPEQLSQLFQPFNRLGQEAGSEQGTGIGLVVAKRLVELMGGHIGVESTIGEGSTFWFELDEAAAPELIIEKHGGMNTPISPGTASCHLHSLLYVEDNPANMRLIELLVARRLDLTLLTAINGSLGLEIARSSFPDVILMDINLPDISGFEALRILKEDSTTRHIPIIALSANAMPRDIEKGLHNGFFKYLTKPIKINEFNETINLVLKYVENITEASCKPGYHHD